MDLIIDILQQEWETFVRFLPRLVQALLALLVAYGIGRAVGNGLAAILTRRKLARTHVAFLRNAVKWAITVLGISISLSVLGLSGLAGGLLAGGGFAAVALGFAFREIGENLLAGLFLAFSRPFGLRDLIESGDHRGVVRGIELRYTHIRASDGRDIFIPNAQIFNRPLTNYTRDGLRRMTCALGIDYRSDVEPTLQRLRDTATACDGVLADPAPKAYVNAFRDQWLEVELAVWVDMLKSPDLTAIRSDVMDRVRRAVLDGGVVVSSEVSSNVDLASRAPVAVELKGTA